METRKRLDGPMTLTELKYIVALAQERHFGKAADACAVSQPTLSLGIKKLEAQLDVLLFERKANEVSLTPIGHEIVRLAQDILEKASTLREVAKRGKNPLAGPLRLGVIYTIAPYLLPRLVQSVTRLMPQTQLILQENFTTRLLEMLRGGELDCVLLAEPFPDAGLAVAPLYDEPFFAAVPTHHALSNQVDITPDQLKAETMLLLGSGHCFRDHVLDICPEFARYAGHGSGLQKSFEGSSLETIKCMVAAGLGVTVVPALSVPSTGKDNGIHYLPFASDTPCRRVVLAWRRSFHSYETIAHVRNAIYACELAGVHRLT